jgi:hypothetical protein
MYEFCRIEVVRLSPSKINAINLSRITEGLSVAEAELSLITRHGDQRLELAGRYGWQIVSVIEVNLTDAGDSLIYFMQRSSEHERFRIRDFKTEYYESALYEKHQKQIAEAARKK